jgi:hypothetical protein
MYKYINIICCFLISSQVAAADSPSPTEILEKFQETQDKIRSFAMKNEIVIDYKTSHPGTGSGKRTYFMDIRTDGSRFAIRKTMWGNVSGAYEFIPKDRPDYMSDLFDNNRRINYSKSYNDVGIAVINKIKIDTTKERVEGGASALSGSIERGYVAGDHERVDSILRSAKHLRVREKTEIINGSECYILEGLTRRGEYILWIDPRHGYNIAKARVTREKGDLYGDIDHPIESGTITHTLDNVRFELNDGVWVPMEIDGTFDRFIPEGPDPKHPAFSKSKFHSKTKKMIINPDHEALGSFLPDDIANGAKVHIVEFPNMEYIWQDGRLIPNIDREVIAEIDKITKEIMADDTKAGPIVESVSPTVSELLDKYAATQDKIKSFIAKAESRIEYTDTMKRTENETCEFRTDGKQVNHRTSFQDNLTTTKDKPGYKSFLWNGESLTQYNKGLVFISKNDINTKRIIATEYKGAPLLGICGGDFDRADSVLRKAGNATVQQSTEKVGDSQCYLIKATKKQSGYKVWIDPQHSYNIAKVEIEQKNNERVISLFTLKNVRFEKIDDVWVPMEADMEQTEGSKAVKWHHKRTKMLLNPDHDALNSFVADDIPDGTKVNISGEFGAQYMWRNGKPIKEATEK